MKSNKKDEDGDKEEKSFWGSFFEFQRNFAFIMALLSLIIILVYKCSN